MFKKAKLIDHMKRRAAEARAEKQFKVADMLDFYIDSIDAGRFDDDKLGDAVAVAIVGGDQYEEVE